MANAAHPARPSLEANSPFELRVSLGEDVPETDVRTALETGDMGFLHSFTTGSTLDGPGVRVVAWTTGCQFKCRYCHNPDTWKVRNGIPVSVNNAIDELRKYRQGLKVMSGGLTISGGEPLVQHRFVMKMFRAAKDMGVHTALDSNGYLGEVLSDEDLQAIDLVLLDLKAWDPQMHEALTGKDNAPVLAFARRLAQLQRPVWVRFVLVPGLTDAPENYQPIASFAASLGNVQRADVLPFHQMGRFKWQQLGIPYTLQDTAPPDTATVDRVVAAFRAAGLQAY
jgi:pyruvate formate lyase activating enzyme